VGFLALVAGIVLSPLMTLDEIVVTGLESVSEEVVVGAVKEQVGTPLALIDYDAIEKRLGGVVQIQSFATELRPPHTLVIRIVERVPIGAISSDAGWDVVDSAGIVLSSSVAPPKTFPRLNIEGVDSAGFTAVVRALLALPPSLRGDVATISAETRDTVRLVLRGVPHEIRWGSDELSTLKAAVLEAARCGAMPRLLAALLQALEPHQDLAQETANACEEAEFVAMDQAAALLVQ
jgi:cell division protein FtsQ